MIPGILILSKQTYGSDKSGKNYYKCIIKNKEILVPYILSYKNFNKNFLSMYVLVELVDENYGHILETIGPVNEVLSFMRYQIYYYGLKESKKIKFEKNSENSEYSNKIRDNTNRLCYSVDNILGGARDLDDAYSITQQESFKILSIYITNVPIIANGINLINYIHNVSSIYGPGKVYNMISKNLSEEFSFLSEKNKVALTLDLKISNDCIIETELYNSIINVENLDYSDKKVSKLIKLLKGLVKEDFSSNEAIEYLMTLMNKHCANFLMRSSKQAIYRVNKNDSSENIKKIDKIDDNLLKFFKYSELASEYSTSPQINRHFNDYYIHITSPMRRLVDLMNMCQINELLGFESDLFKKLSEIYSIDEINRQTSIIKKIQSKVYLLALLEKGIKEVEGYILSDDTVYLPSLMFTYKFKNNLPVYSKHLFKIYVFSKESTFKKKIVLELIQINIRI